MIPKTSIADYSYAEAKIQAETLDRHFGFEFEKIESLIPKSEHHQNWKDLPIQSLMTPYLEIRLILDLLQLPADSLVIDLGSAYGRMAYVIAEYFPDLKFIGFELEESRTQEGRRVFQKSLSSKIQLLTQDLTDPQFHLPQAQAYFIYDFGHRLALEKSLTELKKIGKTEAFKVVARGRGIRHQIHQEHPWLCEVNSPLHTPEFSIYTWQI